MPTPDLCTEDEVTRLVHTFYAKVREDAILGPVFERHVGDWAEHLPKMVDFWSSTLRGTRTYRGTPMPVHCALPGLTQPMFEHWLDLFHDAACELGNDPMAERAVQLSQRIAQSLWYGYQIQHAPSAWPRSSHTVASTLSPSPRMKQPPRSLRSLPPEGACQRLRAAGRH